MWPFKKESAADKAIENLIPAIELASNQWLSFCQRMPFKEGVPLEDRVLAFLIPFTEGLRAKIPALKSSPDAFILLVVAKGVEASGTHSTAEIEQALKIRLPSFR